MINDSLIVTTYGNGDENRGIKIIACANNQERQFLPIDGKCNFCLTVNDYLYASAQKESSCCMVEYRYEKGKYIQIGSYPTQYFYSHGVIYKDKLLLASFSDGIDAIYDPNQHKEIDFYIHKRTGYEINGRSHYIGVTQDKSHAFSVDNGLQQIYLYKIVDSKFVLCDIREFWEENIRLISYSSFSDCYYMNTEKTNRVYVLEYSDERFHIRYVTDLSYEDGAFSGANAVSSDGKHLCVSIRGDDILYYFAIEPHGKLKLLDKVHCSKMPRDAIFKGDNLYVTCTNDNAIERYDVKDGRLKKVEVIPIHKPITFGL